MTHFLFKIKKLTLFNCTPTLSAQQIQVFLDFIETDKILTVSDIDAGGEFDRR
jgi:hypothetical protein